LYIISKDEDQWWTARNSVGLTGQIPVPYVEVVRMECNYAEHNNDVVLSLSLSMMKIHEQVVDSPTHRDLQMERSKRLISIESYLLMHASNRREFPMLTTKLR